MSLSVCLITQDEELHIEECLACVAWVDEKIVVDGGSRDATVEKARALTDKVFEIPFVDFASQKNAAIARASSDWILILDADERVDDDLKKEILEKTAAAPDHCYAVGRKTYFFGRRLHFSGTREDYPVRLFPRGKARFTQPVHEELLTALPIKKTRGKLIHYSTRDREHYLRKMRCYVRFELEVLRKKGTPRRFIDRWLRAGGRFIDLYFLKFGFLDGLAGLQFASYSAMYAHNKYKQYYEDGGKGARQ